MPKEPIYHRPAPSPWCEVRASGVHGRGLFATRRIPKGTQVIEYGGEVVSRKEGDRRGIAWAEEAAKTGDASVYVFTLTKKKDIDGNFPWNDARLINHSCDPNCETEIDENNHVWVLALRDIAGEEELFYDYNFDAEHYEDHPCRCGAPDCFGYIVGEDYRDDVRKLIRKKEKKAAKKAKKKTKGKKSGRMEKRARKKTRSK